MPGATTMPAASITRSPSLGVDEADGGDAAVLDARRRPGGAAGPVPSTTMPLRDHQVVGRHGRETRTRSSSGQPTRLSRYACGRQACAWPTSSTVRRAEVADFDSWFQLLAEVAAEGRWIGTEAPVQPGVVPRCVPRAASRASQPGRGSSPRSTATSSASSASIAGGRGQARDDGGRRYRGRGIGSALMEACIAWSRASRPPSKVTLTVWPHNAAGLALYRRDSGSRWRVASSATGGDGPVRLWDGIPMGLVLDDTSPGSPRRRRGLIPRPRRGSKQAAQHLRGHRRPLLRIGTGW